ncbi:MAG TPA: FtsQ-type POTRA domain-containing protein [Acidobacteriaceae bacterium]|nr:FtsQ-type POTRA domain-containing protein [Acidobacteriaceae bacterium]
MAKNTASDGRTGLLESEETKQFLRSKIHAETADIPQPVIEEPASQDADRPFLRSQRRVPVRRRGGSRFASRFGWNSRWIRVLAALVVVVALGAVAALGLAVRSLLLHNRHFILQSTETIQIGGNRVVTDSQALAVFAADVGRSIFRVPLAIRQAQLEQIKWVRRATVMRLWPNQLRVVVVERTPVAFVRDGNTVRLVDDDGVLLDLPAAVAQHYSFPVLDGISAADPLSIRAARIRMYRQFVRALDAQGGRISSTLSEVDLSDPEDIRAIFLGGAQQPLVHFGDADFLARYQAYQAHLEEWLQQYPQLRSVDMRYGRQVVLDTGAKGTGTAASAANSVTDATQPGQADQQGTDASETLPPPVSPAKPAQKTKASKPTPTTHHRAPAHPRASRHAPKRGHRVRHPIMHVVSGM